MHMVTFVGTNGEEVNWFDRDIPEILRKARHTDRNLNGGGQGNRRESRVRLMWRLERGAGYKTLVLFIVHMKFHGSRSNVVD